MNNLELVKKPRLGSAIYVEHYGSITKCHVYMKGKTEFCHGYSFNDDFVEGFRQPLRYDDYGKTWFTTLKQVCQKYENKIKLIKLAHNYWEIVNKEVK